MRRRDFLSLANAACGLPLAACGDPTPTPSHEAVLGPYVCDPRPDAMGFYVASRWPAELGIDVFDFADVLVARRAFRVDAHGIGRVDATGLAADTDYFYRLVSPSTVLAVGTFRTPPLGRSSRVRLAVGADIHGSSRPFVVFDRIREAAPHAMLCLGDQVYADLGEHPPAYEEGEYRAAYETLWKEPSLEACWRDVPAYLIWDDHEITNDYDGGQRSRFVAARAAYDAYQGIRNPPRGSTDGRWFRFSVGPVDGFVLDTRSHRSPNAMPDGPDKTMLGAEQRAALEAFLLTSDAPVKLIASPTPLHPFTTTGPDAWYFGFRQERDALFAFLRDEAVGNVLIVSGDQHWPAVVRHDLGAGRAVHELQCTPFAAFRLPPPIAADPSLLWVGEGTPGYGALDVDATGATPVVRFAWVDGAGIERHVVPSVPLS